MAERNSFTKRSTGPQSFPFGVFWTVLALICLALALSATHTFTTLNELRTEYLRNRAHELATAIEQQTRGPGRRGNLEIWQQALEDTIDRSPESVAFISVVDNAGNVLARAGNKPAAGEFFFIEVELRAGRGRGWGQGSGPASTDWHIEMALYNEQAELIGRQARLHAIVAGIAILTLLGLAFYFVKTLNRFLVLRNREESERHLTVLGAMSATLAHEIRNPLGAMKGLTQVVQEDLPEGHRSQELMKTVVEEAERLEQLVTDLLTFARPAELKLTDFNLSEIVREVSFFLTSQANKAGVTIRVPDEPVELMIHSDLDGLKQILLNLIINAVEFTPRDGKVNVGLTSDPRTNQATVTILDEGPGLGDTNPAELFQPFKTTKLKGSGLGLAVSNQIVQRLGGSISLENARGGGTLCTLRIPVNSS